ncbi:MAG TPA: hypothetical protein VKR54_00105 [Candidatus Babeliales bacterium]|jgi:hypothetical protein|nr:hypothetical protein [Candidatus Babeliales bacterium]
MKYNNPLYATLCSALIVFFPAFGMMEEQENLPPIPKFGQESRFFSPDQPLLFPQPSYQPQPLITESEQNVLKAMPSGNIEQLRQSSLPFQQPKKEKISLEIWPTTPKEQVLYLNTTKWDIPTKTYILQLLWWNTAKDVMTATGRTAQQKRENQQQIIQQKNILKDALEKIKQTIPASQQNEKFEFIPLFTYQLKRIPKDAAQKLKDLLLSSFNATQKEAYEKRIQLEATLKDQEAVIKDYKSRAQTLSLEQLSTYNDVLRERQKTLETYLSVLQPYEEKLKKTIRNNIGAVRQTIRQAQAKQMKDIIFRRIDRNDPLPDFQRTEILTQTDIQDIKNYLQNKINEKTKFLLEVPFFGTSATKKKEFAPQILSNIVFLATNIEKADKDNIALIQKFTRTPIFQRPGAILNLLENEQDQIAFINAKNIISKFLPIPSSQSVAEQSPSSQTQQIVQIPTTTTSIPKNIIPYPPVQQPVVQPSIEQRPSQNYPPQTFTQPVFIPMVQPQPTQPPTQNFFTTTIAPLWNQFTHWLSGITSWMRNLWPWK